MFARGPVPALPFDALSLEALASRFLGTLPVVLEGGAASWPACKTWSDRVVLAALLGGEGEMVKCEESSSGMFNPSRRTTSVVTLSVGEMLDRTLFDGTCADQLAAPAAQLSLAALVGQPMQLVSPRSGSA
jgi:hypothetical protein